MSDIQIIPLSQMTRPLSPSEESGELARHLGLRPNRTMQPPRQRLAPSNVRFVWPWPMPSQHHPRPGAA